MTIPDRSNLDCLEEQEKSKKPSYALEDSIFPEADDNSFDLRDYGDDNDNTMEEKSMEGPMMFKDANASQISIGERSHDPTDFDNFSASYGGCDSGNNSDFSLSEFQITTEVNDDLDNSTEQESVRFTHDDSQSCSSILDNRSDDTERWISMFGNSESQQKDDDSSSKVSLTDYELNQDSPTQKYEENNILEKSELNEGFDLKDYQSDDKKSIQDQQLCNDMNMKNTLTNDNANNHQVEIKVNDSTLCSDDEKNEENEQKEDCSDEKKRVDGKVYKNDNSKKFTENDKPPSLIIPDYEENAQLKQKKEDDDSLTSQGSCENKKFNLDIDKDIDLDLGNYLLELVDKRKNQMEDCKSVESTTPMEDKYTMDYDDDSDIKDKYASPKETAAEYDFMEEKDDYNQKTHKTNAKVVNSPGSVHTLSTIGKNSVKDDDKILEEKKILKKPKFKTVPKEYHDIDQESDFETLRRVVYGGIFSSMSSPTSEAVPIISPNALRAFDELDSLAAEDAAEKAGSQWLLLKDNDDVNKGAMHVSKLIANEEFQGIGQKLLRGTKYGIKQSLLGMRNKLTGTQTSDQFEQLEMEQIENRDQVTGKSHTKTTSEDEDTINKSTNSNYTESSHEDVCSDISKDSTITSLNSKSGSSSVITEDLIKEVITFETVTAACASINNKDRNANSDSGTEKSIMQSNQDNTALLDVTDKEDDKSTNGSKPAAMKSSITAAETTVSAMVSNPTMSFVHKYNDESSLGGALMVGEFNNESGMEITLDEEETDNVSQEQLDQEIEIVEADGYTSVFKSFKQAKNVLESEQISISPKSLSAPSTVISGVSSVENEECKIIESMPGLLNQLNVLENESEPDLKQVKKTKWWKGEETRDVSCADKTFESAVDVDEEKITKEELKKQSVVDVENEKETNLSMLMEVSGEWSESDKGTIDLENTTKGKNSLNDDNIKISDISSTQLSKPTPTSIVSHVTNMMKDESSIDEPEQGKANIPNASDVANFTKTIESNCDDIDEIESEEKSVKVIGSKSLSIRSNEAKDSQDGNERKDSEDLADNTDFSSSEVSNTVIKDNVLENESELDLKYVKKTKRWKGEETRDVSCADKTFESAVDVDEEKITKEELKKQSVVDVENEKETNLSMLMEVSGEWSESDKGTIDLENTTKGKNSLNDDNIKISDISSTQLSKPTPTSIVSHVTNMMKDESSIDEPEQGKANIPNASDVANFTKTIESNCDDIDEIESEEKSVKVIGSKSLSIRSNEAKDSQDGNERKDSEDLADNTDFSSSEVSNTVIKDVEYEITKVTSNEVNKAKDDKDESEKSISESLEANKELSSSKASTVCIKDLGNLLNNNTIELKADEAESVMVKVNTCEDFKSKDSAPNNLSHDAQPSSLLDVECDSDDKDHDLSETVPKFNRLKRDSHNTDMERDVLDTLNDNLKLEVKQSKAIEDNVNDLENQKKRSDQHYDENHNETSRCEQENILPSENPSNRILKDNQFKRNSFDNISNNAEKAKIIWDKRNATLRKNIVIEEDKTQSDLIGVQESFGKCMCFMWGV